MKNADKTMKITYTLTEQAVFVAVGGWLGYFLGGCDGLLYALLVFVVLDYITGIMRAIADKKLSSAVGFKGICRNVLIFALVGIGHLLDTQIFGEAGVLRTAVVFFYLSNEGLSLVENAAYLGLPIPEKLSPNHSGQRTHSIDRITPHCVVGQCTAEEPGDWFAKSSTQASSNYSIDKDGRVGDVCGREKQVMVLIQ